MPSRFSAAVVPFLYLLQHDSVTTAFSLSGGTCSTRPTGYHGRTISSNLLLQNQQPSWNPLAKTSRSSKTRTTGRLSMAIDRMSDECIGAIMTSHREANAIGMQTLTNEMIMVGIVGKPERAEGMLDKYNLKYDLVKESAITMIRKSDTPLREGGNDDPKPLPFGDDAKNTLASAVKISDELLSVSVRSEHVLMALLGYNSGRPIQIQTRGYDVLYNTDGLVNPDTFKAYDFCEELQDDLLRQPPTDVSDPSGTPGVPTSRVEEVVIGGGDPGATATLDDVGVDLTQMALEGKLDVVYGRSDEIRQCLRTLGRRRKNNPCLIGDPGVGKTAIAEGIAQVLASSYVQVVQEEEQEKKIKFPKISNPFKKNKEESNGSESIANGDDVDDSYEGIPIEELPEAVQLPPCPKALAGYRLVSVELASLVAGTRNRGDFEEKVQKLIRETKDSNVILFIDEIHNIIGTGGGGDGAMNAANLLKPALARGELKLLGATTTSEYRRYIEKDGALERRFQPLDVKEPTVDQTMEILGAIVPQYEEFHGVKYTMNALWAAAKLSDRYIADRFLPDKAIDLLDEAGSMVKMIENREEDDDDFFVTDDTIAEVVAEISGIPVGRLDTGEKARLRKLEAEIGKRIKGQERAVRSVAKSIRRARSGLRDGRRPVASFLFCGPTGVGKTEVCKALAETYFGQEKDMIRIDMSEYMERQSVSRLVGSPPGYVGYEEGGQLTEAIRRNPHSVVLFDELEKAHEDVLNVLLQVMDEGTLTDGKGRTVSFRNCIFVMTSNVGSQRILDISKTKGGGSTSVEASLEMANVVKEELEKNMKPELLNRIDEIVVFSPLSYDNLRDIASNILKDTIDRAKDDQDLTVTATERLIEAVTRDGLQTAAQFGARPIRRAAQRYFEDTLSEAIMREFLVEGDDDVVVDIAGTADGVSSANDQLVVKITRDGGRDRLMVDVEDDAGIGSVEEDLDWDAVNRPMPPMPDSSWG